jgi:murein DD-endopeptidase MepM/ murein hydrolase activator NlpD
VNKRFTVTVHDVNGVRQFNLHQIVKKIILYVVLFLLFLFVSGASIIIYLSDSLNDLDKKRALLITENKTLQESVGKIESVLNAKREELSSVSDKLSDIEELIGLSTGDETTLQERVDVAKITSKEISMLLKFIPNGSPIEYNGITSSFGLRIHPTLNRQEMHRGLDMKAAMMTPVYATADGVAEWSGMHKSSGYGNLIILDHSYGFKSYFGHLNKVVIKQGDFIKKGDLIAYTGNTGMSSGPHLHYEIRFVQHPIDPKWFVNWDVKNYKDIFEKEKEVPWQSLITAVTTINQ